MNTIILDSDAYSPEAIKFYKSLGRVWLWDKISASQKKKILPGVDIIVTRLNFVKKDLIDKTPNLKIIASNTTGLNHIDVDYAKEKGVKIISLRGHKGFLREITSTAELTFGLMFALIRNIPEAFEDVKKGNWDRNTFRGHQLRGMTLGILGFGRLGKIVARYARAFGMNIIAHDPNVSNKFIARQGVGPVSMKQLFKDSDILTVQVLLVPQTKNLITASHLKLMKPTAYLINTARGEIIKKGSLVMALKKKWIKGAAIDVMWDESLDGKHLKKDPLWAYAKKNNNILIVPHIGGAAYEAMHTTENYIANLVKAYIAKKKLK